MRCLVVSRLSRLTRLCPALVAGTSTPASCKQSGIEIVEVEQGVGSAIPGRHAWAAHDERDAHAVVVEILLAHQAVLADAQTMVGGVDDDGVVSLKPRASSVSRMRPISMSMCEIML